MKSAFVHVLAVWVAMCCCQWRAVAATLGVGAMPSCCAPVEPVDACCDHGGRDQDSPGHSERSPSDEGRCTGCCDKALAIDGASLPDACFDLHLDSLGTMLLCPADCSARPSGPALERGSVWHPPPGRFRPLLCILTV
ncbi:MAG: hypothetical protein KGR22_04490 [Planctomycetes bacterium]|nr:hypothetical protein [Planctomycetota bacterium]